MNRTALALLALVCAASPAFAQQYRAAVPPSITTPDSVETRIGTLKFFDGLPDAETVQKAYEGTSVTGQKCHPDDYCHSGNGRLWSFPPGHSGLMFANLITLVHFSIFSAMNLANSPGEFGGTATTPSSANRC